MIAEVVFGISVIRDTEVIDAFAFAVDFESVAEVASVDNLNFTLPWTTPGIDVWVALKLEFREFAIFKVISIAVSFVFGEASGGENENNGCNDSNQCREEAGLPFSEDTENEDWDNAKAIDGCDKMIRKSILEAVDIPYTSEN